jgi:hypothetical protein
VIEMKQPSLVLNSCDIQTYKFQMQYSWSMPPNASAHDVVYWILYAVEHSEELELKNVIIHCHGLPGELYIGGQNAMPMGVESVPLFAQLRTKDIGTIWLHSCSVEDPGTTMCSLKTKTCEIAGPVFCSGLAQAVGCDVVAADSLQYGAYSPWGSMDDFEGTAYLFSPAGGRTVYSRK